MWSFPHELSEVLPALVAAGLLDGLRRLLGLRKSHPCRVAEAPAGKLVLLTGTARRGAKTLTTPISAQPCIAFQVHVERFEQGTDGGRYYPLDDDEGREDFFLEDDTGRARLLGAKIEIAARRSDGWQRSKSDERLQRFLTQRGQSYQGTLRWRELLIHEGDCIEVVGLATKVKPDSGSATTAPAQGYRRPPPPELVIDAPDIDWIKVRVLPR